MTQIYDQNEYKGRKEAGYYLNWPRNMNSLSGAGQGELVEMYPFDGYWVFLRGKAVTYLTPVDNMLPGKVND